MTPQAGAPLGLTIGEARLTVEELNRRLRERGPDDSDGAADYEWVSDWEQA
jgi:hypothetical protein